MTRKSIVLKFDSDEAYKTVYSDLFGEDKPDKEDATITETSTEVIVQIHRGIE